MVVTPHDETSDGNSPHISSARVMGNSLGFGHEPGGGAGPTFLATHSGKDFRLFPTTDGGGIADMITTVPTTTYNSQTVHYPIVLTLEYNSNSTMTAYWKTYNASGNTGVKNISDDHSLDDGPEMEVDTLFSLILEVIQEHLAEKQGLKIMTGF